MRKVSDVHAGAVARLKASITQELIAFTGIAESRLTVVVSVTPSPSPEDPHAVKLSINTLLDGREPEGPEARPIKQFFDNLKLDWTES